MKLIVKYHDRAVGRLRDDQGRVLFSYSPEWIEGGLELSPIHMPRHMGVLENPNPQMLNLPGLFFDSLPDAWGLHVMRRHFAQQNIRESELTPLSLLAYLHTRAMGALTYHLEEGPYREKILRKQLDLAILTAEAENLLRDVNAHLSAQFDKVSSAAGGARPKVLVAIRGNDLVPGTGEIPSGYEPWLIKLATCAQPNLESPWSPSELHEMEFAYSRMAGAAGIPMAEMRLISDSKGRVHFATRRFDRLPGEGEHQKIHLQSLAGVTHQLQQSDYSVLFATTARLCQDYQQLLDVFRRMVFNVATANCDDHARNFSFLMDSQGRWSLSPAYDLTFCPCGNPRAHAMSVNRNPNPERSDLLRLAEAHSLEKKHIREILDQVREAVGKWEEFAGQADLSRANMREVREAIDECVSAALVEGTGRALPSPRPLSPAPKPEVTDTPQHQFFASQNPNTAGGADKSLSRLPPEPDRPPHGGSDRQDLDGLPERDGP